MNPQDREERQLRRVARVCEELRAVVLDRGKPLAEVEAKFKGVLSAARKLRNLRSGKYVISTTDTQEFLECLKDQEDHPGYGHGV